MKPLLVTAVLLTVAAPAFAVGFWAEQPATTASMVWLGLAGLAVAGSPRSDAEADDRGEGSRSER